MFLSFVKATVSEVQYEPEREPRFEIGLLLSSSPLMAASRLAKISLRSLPPFAFPLGAWGPYFTSPTLAVAVELISPSILHLHSNAYMTTFMTLLRSQVKAHGLSLKTRVS